VQVFGDTVPEDVEDFFVRLSHPRNARVRVNQAIGKIAADDLPGPFTVVADLTDELEGPGRGKATMTLDAQKSAATFTLQVASSRAIRPEHTSIHARWRSAAVIRRCSPFRRATES
jgi:hypothetical protein